MSEVIDELVVTIGLDPSKFIAGQKQSADSMKKTQEELTKRAKLMEESGKGVSNTLISIRNEFLALGAAIVGSQGVRQFVEQMSRANTELSNFSATLNTSPQYVWGLNAAIQELGGSADDGANLLGALNKQIKDAQLNAGRLPASLTQMASRVGMTLDQSHGPVEYLKSLSAAAKALADQGPQSKSIASALLEQGGFDVAQITAMEKYGAAIDTVAKSRGKLGPSAESIASSKEFVDLWTKFGEEMGRLYNDTLPHLLGPIDGLLRSVNSALDRLNAYNRGDAPSAAKNSLMHPGRDGSLLFGHDPDVMANPDIPDPGDLYRLDRRIHGERATGGQVDAGKRYLVGERGPELFTPGSYGGITPNSALGGGIEVDGRPISRGNPMPVTLTGRDGSGPRSLWDAIFGTDTSSSDGGGSSPVASLGNAFGNLFRGKPNGGGSPASGGGSQSPWVPGPGGSPVADNGKPAEVLNWLMKTFNLTKEQALGPLGFMGFESGDFNHMHQMGANPATGDLGYPQWSGSRRRAMEAWVAKNMPGVRSDSDEASRAYLEYDLKTNHPGILRALQNTTTPDQSMAAWVPYEGPYGPGTYEWNLHHQKLMQYVRRFASFPSTPTAAAQHAPLGANFNGNNPYRNLAPRAGYHWDSVLQRQVPNELGDHGFHRDFGSGGFPSALSLSTMSNRQNVFSSPTSNALHIGRIDVNAPRAQNAQEIGAGISDALRSNLFAMMAQSGQV